MNILAEDGELNNDTLARIMRLRNHVDIMYEKFQANWEGEIFLSKDDFKNKSLVNLDAIQYAGSNEYTFYPPKYFDTEKYSTVDGFSGDGFKSLLLRLRSQSNKSGFTIHKKGKYKYDNVERCRIVCNRYEKYRGKTEVRESQSYRDHSFHNNRKHSRGKPGRKMNRKGKTSRSKCNTATCRFWFYIEKDDTGFYVAKGSGCKHHSSHPRVASSILKTSFDQLDPANRQLIFDLYENSVSTPLIGQVLQSRTGLTYSNAKVAYHAG